MSIKLPKLIATSVVRGSQQGESHGGIYTIDFVTQQCDMVVDWNTADIDFEGRGADRGLRGIAFNGEDIFIAASDELFVYDRDFKIKTSFRNRYLKHCHEICQVGNKVFLTATGFDSILAYDLDERAFTWGFHLLLQNGTWTGHTFDPRGTYGPRATNDFHINMVHVDNTGIYVSGLKTQALLRINAAYEVNMVCDLPSGTHNARPFANGVLFNDTASDAVRYVPRDGKQRAFKIPTYDPAEIMFAGIDDSKIARQGFGRGLCPVTEDLIAAGSSPSTISLYSLGSGQKLVSVNMTMDIRNAIHGLAVWPYED